MKKKFFLVLLLCLSFTINLSAYKYRLSAGMIFKNEASYLKEWIEYHRLVGVQHFYLFNNDSTDNYREVLQPYIAKGWVELFDANTQNDFNGTQVDCYNRALIASFGVSKWIAMIDSDEFLVTPKGVRIADVLRQYEDYAGVAVNWRSFGTSGVEKIPDDKLMIECLTHCAPPEHHMNHIVKCIVRPERSSCFGGPHWPELVPGWTLVNSVGQHYEPGTSFSHYSQLWINHYWTRDEDFLINVKVARSIAWGCNPQGILDTAAALNLCSDDCILRHVPKLRKRMFVKP